MMTKRDYEIIAAAFREAFRGALKEERPGVERAMYVLAGELKGDNPRFDAQKFINACGAGRE
jgi:hypothetical protein